MPFPIPWKHRWRPEARAVRRIDAEHNKACAREWKALQKGLHRTDPAGFHALCDRTLKLGQALHAAKAAYDLATGGPDAIPLSPELTAAIHARYLGTQRDEVIGILSRTLGYLHHRQGVNHPGIGFAILQLADVRHCTIHELARLAREDYRDLILAVESLHDPSPQSTPPPEP